MQETHSCTKWNALWSSEWGNKIIFANGDSNARGVAILCNNRISNNISDIVHDINGRYVIIKVDIENSSYVFCNIYAPNNNDPNFFRNVFEEINKLQGTFVVIGVDANVTIDPDLDRSSKKEPFVKSHEVIRTTMKSKKWSDIWRLLHPSDRKFSWCKHFSGQWSRIDWFLISDSLINRVQDCDIIPSICSDHSILKLSFTCNNIERGPGLWKFNNNLLNNVDFWKIIDTTISHVINNHSHMDITDLWELVKSEVMRISRQFAKEKRKQEKCKEYELYILKERLQYDSLNEPDNRHINKTFQSVQNELNCMAEWEVKKCAFRCKAKWIKEGEKNTKYFYNLEKRNYIAKNMNQTLRADGTVTTNSVEILEILSKFYEKLYTRNESVNFQLVNKSNVCLSHEESSRLDVELSEHEIFDAMMTLKPNKTPGCHGLTIEFYRRFWKNLKQLLIKLYDSCITRGQLNPSARRGVVNLIPKKGKDPILVKNWRPINLLNYDYKILAKAVANRLEMVTDMLIGQQHKTNS